MDTPEAERADDFTTSFRAREQRARARLHKNEGEWWNFALLGVSDETEEFRLTERCVFRRVTEPPSEIELARGLKSPEDFIVFARYARGLRYELAVGSGADSATFAIFGYLISALRARSGIEILVPMAANKAWDTIAAAEPNSVEVRLMEDIPRAFQLEQPKTLRPEDFNWVNANLSRFVELMKQPRFMLAVEALTTSHHQSNLRMMTASLWVGIETLFDISAELRFRLAMCVATYLEPRGPSRLSLYREMKKLYDFRSSVIHGHAKIDDTQLSAHIQRTRTTLRLLICKMAEQGKIPSTEDIEQLAFEG